MNWTLEHWTNLGMFIATLAFTGLATVDTWQQVPLSMSPSAVSSFALAVLTFIKTMYTQKPRDPIEARERRTDPKPVDPPQED